VIEVEGVKREAGCRDKARHIVEVNIGRQVRMARSTQRKGQYRVGQKVSCRIAGCNFVNYGSI